MHLIRWDPFATADEMFSRIPGTVGRWARTMGHASEWSPSVDISENAQEYLIRAELPAVQKENIALEVQNGLLTLSGERKQQQEQKDEKFHKVESVYGTFVRTFALPEAADSTGIHAESKDGIVTIHIPKAKMAAPKATTIKVQ